MRWAGAAGLLLASVLGAAPGTRAGTPDWTYCAGGHKPGAPPAPPGTNPDRTADRTACPLGGPHHHHQNPTPYPNAIRMRARMRPFQPFSTVSWTVSLPNLSANGTPVCTRSTTAVPRSGSPVPSERPGPGA